LILENGTGKAAGVSQSNGSCRAGPNKACEEIWMGAQKYILENAPFYFRVTSPEVSLGKGLSFAISGMGA